MLNEAPKKRNIDYAHPTKAQLFWRIQKECWRRMVTPYLMYFFMSLIMLACQAIGNLAARIVLGVLCILGGAFFNGHLLYNCGAAHYGIYVSGELHRRNELFGIVSGGDHHPEREYRPWKGALIGLFIGVPVIPFAVLAGLFYDSLGGNIAQLALIMFAGWAIIPITWFGTKELPGGTSGLKVSPYWSMLMILLPILVSTVFYIVGAMVDKHKREEANARAERVRAARYEKPLTPQTEEQRKKTLQSKKKK